MQRYCPKCFSRYDQELERCPADNEKLVLINEDDLVGKVLDERYKILSKLGEGGMGAVYVAEQAIIGRKVALKVLRGAMVQDESSVKRFLTEAKAIASLKSPNTITLHDFGVTREGQLYYTMENLEGLPLSKLIKRDAPMDHDRAAALLLQAALSLEEAHDKGILHRDIKPDNIFVTWEKDVEHVTVLDFGIAKLGEDPALGTITKTGMLCGTPAYLSPEQAQGYAAVPASDLYALAIVFYEMLAGEPPFSDTTAMRVLMKHVHEQPTRVSVKNPDIEVPVAIEEFLLKGLAKKPEERYEDVAQFREALEQALAAAAFCPDDTTALPALGTNAAGLRSVTEPLNGEAFAVDPMAGTMMSTEPVQTPVPAAPHAPGPATAALVRDASAHRWPLYVGVAAVLLIAVVLGLWRPWEGGDVRGVVPAESVVAASGRSTSGPTAELPPEPQAATPEPVVVAPEPVVVTPEPVVVTPEPVVVTPEPVIVTPEPVVVTPEPVVVSPEPKVDPPVPDPNPELATAAELPAAPSREAIEAEQHRLEAERARKRRESRRAAEAAAKKAAAEAAAKKAAAEAAAKKSPLGFRKVNVETKPAAPEPEEKKPDSGLGFRKVKVEDQ